MFIYFLSLKLSIDTQFFCLNISLYLAFWDIINIFLKKLESQFGNQFTQLLSNYTTVFYSIIQFFGCLKAQSTLLRKFQDVLSFYVEIEADKLHFRAVKILV